MENNKIYIGKLHLFTRDYVNPSSAESSDKKIRSYIPNYEIIRSLPGLRLIAAQKSKSLQFHLAEIEQLIKFYNLKVPVKPIKGKRRPNPLKKIRKFDSRTLFYYKAFNATPPSESGLYPNSKPEIDSRIKKIKREIHKSYEGSKPSDNPPPRDLHCFESIIYESKIRIPLTFEGFQNYIKEVLDAELNPENAKSKEFKLQNGLIEYIWDEDYKDRLKDIMSRVGMLINEKIDWGHFRQSQTEADSGVLEHKIPSYLLEVDNICKQLTDFLKGLSGSRKPKLNEQITIWVKELQEIQNRSNVEDKLYGLVEIQNKFSLKKDAYQLLLRISERVVNHCISLFLIQALPDLDRIEKLTKLEKRLFLFMNTENNVFSSRAITLNDHFSSFLEFGELKFEDIVRFVGRKWPPKLDQSEHNMGKWFEEMKKQRKEDNIDEWLEKVKKPHEELEGYFKEFNNLREKFLIFSEFYPLWYYLVKSEEMENKSVKSPSKKDLDENHAPSLSLPKSEEEPHREEQQIPEDNPDSEYTGTNGYVSAGNPYRENDDSGDRVDAEEDDLEAIEDKSIAHYEEGSTKEFLRQILDDDEYEIIVATVFDGYTQGEIAKNLKLSQGAVSKKKASAIKKLKSIEINKLKKKLQN